MGGSERCTRCADSIGNRFDEYFVESLWVVVSGETNEIQYAWSQVIRGDYFEATVYMGYMLTHRDRYMKRQLLPYHDPSADVLDNMYKK